jgi:beta-carotene ketolase (CrtW type)
MKRAPAYAGLIPAFAIIATWLGSLAVLFGVELTASWQTVVLVPLAMAWMTFLSTGLFITAHDAMHGTVAPGRKRLNDAVGALAVALYALFSYRKLQGKHHEHHAHPGEAGEDPDFHDGDHPGFWRWYLHFVFGYVGLLQIIGMAVAFNVLSHLIGIPEPNLLLFWVAPALLSTLQLFYFGTYLPHREPHADGDPHNARSNAYPPWLSFLTCYHFGYHREHHEHPGVPWWRLPAMRRQMQSEHA